MLISLPYSMIATEHKTITVSDNSAMMFDSLLKSNVQLTSGFVLCKLCDEEPF